MVYLLTEARKATTGALVAFLGPLAALFASDQEITARIVVAALMAGLIAGLTVWGAPNTEEYVPVGRHAAGD